MSPSGRDTQLLRWLAFAAGLTSAVLVLIVLFLVRESWPVIARFGPLCFLTDRGWHPTEGNFNIVPMLAASAATSALAIALATPLGVAAAIFSRFYAASIIGQLLHWMIVLLAGIPSVVLGLWGLTVIVPLILKVAPPGTSMLAGSLILGLMILPTIALTTEAALASLPSAYGIGAAALGLSREAIIINIAIPATKASIFAGVMLASARALGETMAVLMVTGNVVQLPKSLFDPVRTLTANIALEMAYATGHHRASLFVSGLALTAVVLALAAVARRSGGQVVHA